MLTNAKIEKEKKMIKAPQCKNFNRLFIMKICAKGM